MEPGTWYKGEEVLPPFINLEEVSNEITCEQHLQNTLLRQYL
jgi:hypothetical protein